VLAGGGAHDFNNILQAIGGQSELAALALAECHVQHPAIREAHDALETVQQATQRAAELTHQLLAYAGSGALHVTVLDLNLLIAEMATLLHTSIAKGVVLDLALAPGPLLVEGDGSQLRQVVMNLVLNASEAITGDGVVTLTTHIVSLDHPALLTHYRAPDLAPGHYIQCTLRDTGVGMDAATLARIYEPFFTTKFTGRGLGLAAVQGIVRRHGGAIRVQSAPGEGSTFTVIVPLGDKPLSLPRKIAVAVAPRQLHGHVLVVDDEPAVCRLLVATLALWGVTAAVAVDGYDGSRAVRAATAIDCVLLDVTMPRGGAAAVVQTVAALGPTVPVVLMSGYSERDALSAVSGVPIAGFVQKPFTVTVLRAVLEPLLADTRER